MNQVRPKVLKFPGVVMFFSIPAGWSSGSPASDRRSRGRGDLWL